MDEKKRCPIWTLLKKLKFLLVLYLDDLLFIGGGCCVVRAAWEGLGRPAGLAVAGGVLWLYALIVARSNGREL